MKNKEVTKEDLIKALRDIVWYNCLYESENIPALLKLEKGKYGYITYPTEILNGKLEMQYIWAMCVSMFGDYGTSVFSGWIEDVEGFRSFLESLIPYEDEMIF